MNTSRKQGWFRVFLENIYVPDILRYLPSPIESPKH